MRKSILSSGLGRLIQIVQNYPALLIGVSLVVYCVGTLDAINAVVDDVFIPMRYAKNAAAGLGLVFNVGERVEGYSNLLWTLLLTAAVRFNWMAAQQPDPLLVFAKLASVCFGALSILAAALVGRRVWKQWRDKPVVWMIAALGLIAIPAAQTFDFWSASGMETSLCALLVTAAVWAYSRALDEPAKRTGSFWSGVGGLVFGAACLVRPEQTFTWLVAMGIMFITSDREIRRRLMPGILVTAGVCVGLEVWRLTYCGAVLPNSVIAKSGGSLLEHADGIRYGIGGLISILGAGTLGVSNASAIARRSPACRLLVLTILGQGVFVLASGGDWMAGYRFLVPVIPLLCILAYAGLAEFMSRSGIVSLGVPVVLLIAMAGTFFAARRIARAEANYDSGLQTVTWLQDPHWAAAADSARRVLPAGAVLGMTECGEIPYHLESTPVFDMLGLMSPEVARLPGKHMRQRVPKAMFEQKGVQYLLLRAGQGGDMHKSVLAPEIADAFELVAVFHQFQLYRHVREMSPMTPGL